MSLTLPGLSNVFSEFATNVSRKLATATSWMNTQINSVSPPEVTSDTWGHSRNEIYIKTGFGPDERAVATISLSNELLPRGEAGTRRCLELGSVLAPALMKCIRGGNIPRVSNPYSYELDSGQGAQYAVSYQAPETNEKTLLLNLHFYDDSISENVAKSFVSGIPADLLKPRGMKPNSPDNKPIMM